MFDSFEECEIQAGSDCFSEMQRVGGLIWLIWDRNPVPSRVAGMCQGGPQFC